MEQLQNKIQRLYDQNLQYAKDLLEITAIMKVDIEQEDIESLNKNIASRQAYMEQVEEVNKAIKENLEQLQDRLSVESIDAIDRTLYPQVDDILRIKAQIESIYKETYELDKENQQRAAKLLEEYKNGIKGIHRSKHAMNAYGEKPSGQSIIFNKVK